MRSLRTMAVAALLPSRSCLISAFFLTLIWTALGQDPVPTTPANPDLQPTDSPSPSDQPSPTPYPVDQPSTTPSTVTCCYVQTACKGCSEVYSVNSIAYCCPNCRGMVLVTDLVCRCTIPKNDPPIQDLQCKLSNEVVGGYDALRPSYYDGDGAAMIQASVALMLSAVLLASVAL